MSHPHITYTPRSTRPPPATSTPHPYHHPQPAPDLTPKILLSSIDKSLGLARTLGPTIKVPKPQAENFNPQAPKTLALERKLEQYYQGTHNLTSYKIIDTISNPHIGSLSYIEISGSGVRLILKS
jgi:hypothetical protein